MTWGSVYAFLVRVGELMLQGGTVRL